MDDLKRLVTAARSEDLSREAATALSDAASREGLTEVAVASVDSPVGPLLIAVTPRGLARIAYSNESRDVVLDELAADLSPRILESAKITDEARRELEQYFAGDRTSFDLQIDWRLTIGFARKTLRATAKVPFGDLITYGELAKRIDSSGAARAVGHALGSNPIPIVVPCHRVVRAGGALGGYSGGLDKKKLLLALEGNPT